MTQTPLARQKLIRAPLLSMRLETGHVVLTTPNGGVKVSDLALRVLDYFSAPHTIEEALDQLPQPADGPSQWMLLSGTVLSLHRAGGLVNLEESDQRPPLVEGFAGAAIHVAMLNDRRRTSAYLAAIAETVRPGDVVVDLGTGTGILALAAARAGARTVYAIEASAIAGAAEAMFQRNGFADRIRLVRGWSTSITLPEHANVLITETIGHDPFDEGIAEYMTDARKRFLEPGARIIPSAMRVWALPVTIPNDQLNRRHFNQQAAVQWREDYGFDFSPLLGAIPVTPLRLQLSTAVARDLPALADAMLVADIDISQPFGSAIDTHVDFVATGSGCLNGILIYFDLALSPGVSFTTERRLAEDTNSWGHQVLVLPTPLDVMPADSLSLHLDRPAGRLRAVCALR
ncbi:MAG TPA: 50S ribosomal protein L11 methyltransferase [Vicinamibacterales bacterium]|nr:50S ribosomal protein L11 methyltransferase [Vicinamibacterales bacterium]